MTMRFRIRFLLGLVMLAAIPSAALAAVGHDRGDAAHLFGYYPTQGQAARFDEGYRRHLAWHRDRRDPLPWYGWYVASGDRTGMFIDGSFGAPFAAFDQRVDPAGDAADAARNVAPFAKAAFRASYRLRREFSTGFPLERWHPTGSVQVFHYTLHPGAGRRFEAVLRAVRELLMQDDGAPVHTWYELVSGGPSPGYLLMVARDDWRSYDTDGDDVEALLAAAPDARRLLDEYAASVATVESESWSYREDLSYFPARDRGPAR
jgi:hypothetical protein